MKDNFDPKKEFLTPELSSKLISSGFTENCVGIYGGVYGIMFGGPVSFKHEHAYYQKNGAILIQQAEEWFLSKHNWSIEIKSFTKRPGSKTRWWKWGVDNELGIFLSLPREAAVKSKREARLSAIENLLNYLPKGL